MVCTFMECSCLALVAQAHHQGAKALFRPGFAVLSGGAAAIDVGHQLGQRLHPFAKGALDRVAQQVFKQGGRALACLVRFKVSVSGSWRASALALSSSRCSCTSSASVAVTFSCKPCN